MRPAIFSVVAAALAALLLPTAASGSCMEPPPLKRHIEQAESVFVGTVVDLANDRRTAAVQVSEVWRGPDLPAAVTVHGGPDEPDMMTSVDRFYEGGTTYLFAASLVDGRLTDNSCSATRPWDETLDELRPADARPPVAGEPAAKETSLPGMPLALAAAAVLLIGGSALAFRTRN